MRSATTSTRKACKALIDFFSSQSQAGPGPAQGTRTEAASGFSGEVLGEFLLCQFRAFLNPSLHILAFARRQQGGASSGLFRLERSGRAMLAQEALNGCFADAEALSEGGLRAFPACGGIDDAVA